MLFARLRHPPQRWRLIASALLAGALLLVVGDGARRAVSVASEVRAAESELTTLRDTLAPLMKFDASGWPDAEQYDEIVARLGRAEAHTRRAGAALGYWRALLPAFGWVPGYGEQVAHLPRLVDLAHAISVAGTDLVGASDPLFRGDGPAAARAREVFVAGAPRIDAAFAALEAARDETDALLAVEWSGPFARAGILLARLQEDLAVTGPTRATTRALAVGLDPLLGFDGDRIYVVLGQNEQEIRATGGFPGTLGVITVREGRIVQSDYRAVRDFDPEDRAPSRWAPGPIQQFLGIGAWYIRDANWSPHFPESAERVLQFLREDSGIEAHGVIAVNARMTELLLAAIGPTAVPGFDEPVTAENFYILAEEEIFGRADSREAKQELLHPLLQVLIERVQNAGPAVFPRVLSAFQQGALDRSFQMFSRDAGVTHLVEALGVGGELVQPPGTDFVAVVDSNVSYSKIQSVVSRDTIYLARPDGVVDLRVEWRNDLSKYEGPRYRRLGVDGDLWDAASRTLVPAPGVFGNFVRIYLPGGVTLASRPVGFASPPRFEFEGDFVVVSGLVVARDGESAAVHISYRHSPEDIFTGVTFWKQGGQLNDHLRVLRNARGQQTTLFDSAFTADLTVGFDEIPAD